MKRLVLDQQNLVLVLVL